MSKVFDIAFKLGAELTSSFGAAFAEAGKSMKGLEKAGENMKSVGKTMTATVTAPLVGMGAAAFKAAVDYEAAFAGIRKTVDMTETEYAEMSQSIRDMSKEIPASASAIAAVGEAAGQLGIEKENILDFSRTMIDMGEATNLTADEAATSFAQFANVVQMPQENFDRLGSSVVALGNTMATTEADIVEMAMRLSGTGAQVGLTEAQIMALSGTMASVGINAEAGGSAMSTVMKKISNAVSDGGEEMASFAKAAGMSSESFSEAWKSDPITALDSFIVGLGESGEKGENLNAILGDLGIKGIQETDTLLRLAGASDLLSSAVETSTGAWEENTALSDEAAQRYETTAAKMSILWNKITDLGITIGDILIPKVLDLVSKIEPWIEKFANLSTESQGLILTIAGIAAAIGPLLIFSGTLISSIVTIVKTFQGAKAAMQTFRAVIGLTSSSFKSLGLAMLANPVFLVIAAIVALAAVFVVAYKQSEAFRDIINSAFSQISSTVMPMLSEAVAMVKHSISEAIPLIIESLMSIVPTVLMLAQEIIPMILNVVQMVFPVVLSIIQTVLPVFASLITTIISVILQLVQVVIPLILTVVQLVLPIVLGIIEMILPVIAGLFQLLVGVISGVLIPAINAILAVVQMVFPYIQMIIENALTLISGIIQVAMSLLQGDWDGAWNAIKATAETIMNNIISFFSSINLFEVGKTIITGLIDGIKSMGNAVIGAITNMVPAPIRGAVSGLIGKVGGYAKGGIVTAPELAWIGEGGDTESVIPWNNSSRSKDLWFKTGDALGMFDADDGPGDDGQGSIGDIDFGGFKPKGDNGGGGGTVVHFNPTYHINGGNPTEVVEVVEKTNDDLRSQLKDIKDDDERRKL